MFWIKSKNTRLIELLEKDENYISKKLIKKSYKKEWAFLEDEITVGCLSKLWCFVIISGKIYGLNGASIMKYNIKSVNDAKKTIKGKSISDFIGVALNL